MPSTIRGSDNFDTAGGNAVKAWVNFNGTGTVAIRASFNVSSITDNGVGDYTVNITNALADANFAVAGFATFGANDSPAAAFSAGNLYAPTTTSARVKASNTTTGGTQDAPYVNVAFFR